MSEIKLTVEALETKRETVPVGFSVEMGYKELAVGKTSYRLFVRGPYGKLFVLEECPEELVMEIRSAEEAAAPGKVVVRDCVPRDG